MDTQALKIHPGSILSTYDGKNYICGVANKPGDKSERRFAIEIETIFSENGIWAVIEPADNDPSWKDVDQTLQTVCGEKEEE